jgi:hypothetical protein
VRTPTLATWIAANSSTTIKDEVQSQVGPSDDWTGIAGDGTTTPASSIEEAARGKQGGARGMRPLLEDAIDQGTVGSAYEPPKISVFPNVAGQTLFGAGGVFGRRCARQEVV